MVESTNVGFDEVKSNKKLVVNYDKDDDIVHIRTQSSEVSQMLKNQARRGILNKFYKDHPREHIIGSPTKGLLTRSKSLNMNLH